LLPYGSWTLADGTEVLFDRYYAALWQRTPDGAVTRAEVNRWYEVDKHHWFYDDGTSPGRNKETRKKLQALLAEWGVSS
jgi:hypothetical protein